MSIKLSDIRHVIIILLITLFTVFVIYLKPEPNNTKLKAEVTDSDFDISFGSDSTELKVYMFMDYTCTHCKRFLEQTMPKIQEKYIKRGSIKFSIKLLSFSNHPNLHNAYKMAICLNKYVDFEPINELLIHETEVVFSEQFIALQDDYVARNISFAECMYSETVENYLKNNLKTFIANQFTGTPTFVINQKSYKGYLDFDDFAKIIDKEL